MQETRDGLYIKTCISCLDDEIDEGDDSIYLIQLSTPTLSWEVRI